MRVASIPGQACVQFTSLGVSQLDAFGNLGQAVPNVPYERYPFLGAECQNIAN